MVNVFGDSILTAMEGKGRAGLPAGLNDVAKDDDRCAPATPDSGRIEWWTGGVTTFSVTEHVQHIPCFTPGAMVETDRGLVAVEDLVAGDRVLTRDSGYQRVRWASSRRLDADHLARNPALQPIHIQAGALGQGLPLADMIVSPQHRMLITGTRAELLFGEAEVLAAARHLTCLPGIRHLTRDEVTYVHVMFDEHEIIRADGCWTESYQPGRNTLTGMEDAQREELFAIFPELQSLAGREAYATARISLTEEEVRVLVAA
jgi:hypothetical protein